MSLIKEIQTMFAVLDTDAIVLTTTPGDFYGNGTDLTEVFSIMFGLSLSADLLVTDDVRYRFQFSPDDDPPFSVPANIIECSPNAIMPRYNQPDNKLENPVVGFQQIIGIAGESPAQYVRVVLEVVTLGTGKTVTVTPIFKSNGAPFLGATNIKIPNDGRP